MRACPSIPTAPNFVLTGSYDNPASQYRHSYLGLFQLLSSLLYDIHCEVMWTIDVLPIEPIVRGEKAGNWNLLDEGAIKKMWRVNWCTHEGKMILTQFSSLLSHSKYELIRQKSSVLCTDTDIGHMAWLSWLLHDCTIVCHMTTAWMSHDSHTLTFGSYSCDYRHSATRYPDWAWWCMVGHWKVLLWEALPKLRLTLVLLLHTLSCKDAKYCNEKLGSAVADLPSIWLH